MRHSNQLYKSIFLVVILIFGVATLYAIKTEEAPSFILFLGRFHPLLLHLPIGALVVTFFIDILGRIQKQYPAKTISNLLGFTALFAIITCFLGYFLSLEGGYQKDTLDIHFYTGIATLTHGDNFLTEYISVSKQEKTIEKIDSLRLYDDVVAKILDQKCVQCHNASKQKGELSLISKENILKGGENGLSVVSGNAAASLLFARTLLPISDDKHMPPEGKDQLTKDEIWLLEHWINNDLDFENYATKIATNDTLNQKLKKYLVFNDVKIPKASISAIEDVKSEGFRVLELVPGKSRLNVKFLGDSLTQKSADKLALLEDQIIELDFNDAVITDKMTSVLKDLKNLKSLRINSPEITDAAIKNIKSLKQLDVLNVYNTNITNNGLKDLLAVVTPKRIYSWNSQVDKDTAIQLADQYNITINNVITSGFIEDSQLESPEISPTKTLFTDTIHISALSRLKDVDLRYTLDEKTPDSTSKILNEKIVLNNSKTLKVAAFKKGWEPSEILVRNYAKIQHQIKNFNIKQQPDERYPNPNKLFDLKEGSLDFKDGHWVGYFGGDINLTIDLGAIKTVNNISFSCLEDVGSWILYPTNFTVYTSSTKNGNFIKAGKTNITRQGEGGKVESKKVHLNLPETKTRYVKILINNQKVLPDWHPSAGNPSWLFVDEIYLW